MNEKKVSEQAIEIAIRLILLFGILFWCFQIISPFIMPVLWALIIAISLRPLQNFFIRKFKLKPALSAIIITILMLSVILVPAVLFFTSATQVIIELKNQFEQGTFVMPGPPKFIESWPIIGDKLHDFLSDLNANLEAFITKYQSQIIELSKRVVSIIIGTSLVGIQFIVSIIISGIFLAIGDKANFSGNIFTKIIGADGQAYLDLSIQTIRNVVKGVLGVAVIQALLAGLGLWGAGVPHAAIWTLVCLILAIIQIGPGIVMLISMFYVFDSSSTLVASIWSIYFVGVAISDNILKPILLGKGAPVPMLVIFLGVIGGFMYSGFIGLFTGAIVLSIGYKLASFWLQDETQKEAILEEVAADIEE
ncbi:MAG: AI-2E family transporter [Bacteroidetes bacterium B1(2017)]|nr:MAG: AI-2E family transporter [Bacteroidetes bacterium B1(2017)]